MTEPLVKGGCGHSDADVQASGLIVGGCFFIGIPLISLLFI